MEEEDDEHFPAVGFRFYPTEEELVSFYLKNKLNGTRPEIDTLIPVLDIYDYNPSQLPQLAGEHCPADGEQWFFFIPRQEREARGGRPNRLTTEGYWKATGSPGDVYSCQNNGVIGRKRTMVFYVGRAPNGKKTSWKMNEYKAIASDHDQPSSSSSSSSTSATPRLREELSLCRIYKRSKCLRAFDRRPPTAAVRGDPAAARHHHRRDTIFNNQLNNPVEAPEITARYCSCSLDSSSSSGDDQTNINYQSQSLDSGNNPYLGIDNEPFWDWDQFNLFSL